MVADNAHNLLMRTGCRRWRKRQVGAQSGFGATISRRKELLPLRHGSPSARLMMHMHRKPSCDLWQSM